MASFLVRGLSRSLRKSLEQESKRSGRAVQELIRSALCEHYEVDCRQVRQRKSREDAWTRSQTVLLKNMDEQLWLAIQLDSQETGESMISLVREILEARYVTDGRKA